MAVSAHLGLTPEFVSNLGGFRSVGKTVEEAVRVYEDALRLQDAGVMMVELECVPFRVAEEITKRLEAPAMGVGSGSGCDGQVLVLDDMLGAHDLRGMKHNKRYRNFYEDTISVLQQFKDEVNNGGFPQVSNSFKIADEQFDMFVEKIDKV